MSDKTIIAERENDLGTYQLSIEMDTRFLIITEHLQGDWDFVESLWVHKYPAFRDAYHSLKQVQKGAICINRDCHWKNDDGSCYLHVERTYLARSSNTITICELGGTYLRQITMFLDDLDRIITMYDAFLSEEEKA